MISAVGKNDDMGGVDTILQCLKTLVLNKKYTVNYQLKCCIKIFSLHNRLALYLYPCDDNVTLELFQEAFVCKLNNKEGDC